eukprot:UN02107
MKLTLETSKLNVQNSKKDEKISKLEETIQENNRQYNEKQMELIGELNTFETENERLSNELDKRRNLIENIDKLEKTYRMKVEQENILKEKLYNNITELMNENNEFRSKIKNMKEDHLESVKVLTAKNLQIEELTFRLKERMKENSLIETRLKERYENEKLKLQESFEFAKLDLSQEIERKIKIKDHKMACLENVCSKLTEQNENLTKQNDILYAEKVDAAKVVRQKYIENEKLNQIQYENHEKLQLKLISAEKKYSLLQESTEETIEMQYRVWEQEKKSLENELARIKSIEFSKLEANFIQDQENSQEIINKLADEKDKIETKLFERDIVLQEKNNALQSLLFKAEKFQTESKFSEEKLNKTVEELNEQINNLKENNNSLQGRVKKRMTKSII